MVSLFQVMMWRIVFLQFSDEMMEIKLTYRELEDSLRESGKFPVGYYIRNTSRPLNGMWLKLFLEEIPKEEKKK